MVSRPVALLLVAVVGAAAGCGEKGKEDGSRVAQTETVTVETRPTKPTAIETQPVAPPPNYGRQAERSVRAYYRQLNRRQFDGAWAQLSPALQSQLGPYETWIAGYELTEGTDPTVVSASTANARSAEVQVTLATDDLDVCGDHVPQRFSGSWSLSREGSDWKPAAITLEKIGGGDPIRDPTQCLDYTPVDIPPDYVPPEGFGQSGDGDPGTPAYTAPLDFCDVHDCIPNFDRGTGYPVQCGDGSWSQSGGRQGACSWHGGVG